MGGLERCAGLAKVAGRGSRAAPRPVIDVYDPVFLPRGPMTERIVEACRQAGAREPRTRAEVVRCILDSLADAFARTVRDAVRQSRQEVDVVQLVGGGALNHVLCQLTADACQLPVLAGPVEATALGNVLVQARAAGVVGTDLDDLRRLVRQFAQPRPYRPTSGRL